MDNSGISKSVNDSASLRLAAKISASFKNGSWLQRKTTRSTIKSSQSSLSRIDSPQASALEVCDAPQVTETRVDEDYLEVTKLEVAEALPSSSSLGILSQKEAFNSW